MNRLTEQEILSAFQILGLESAEERAKFTRFAVPESSDEQKDYIRLDNTSHADGPENAELA